MAENEIREWIRQNLRIEVEPESRQSTSNSVYVGLRFADEDRPFFQERIYIPEDSQ